MGQKLLQGKIGEQMLNRFFLSALAVFASTAVSWVCMRWMPVYVFTFLLSTVFSIFVCSLSEQNKNKEKQICENERKLAETRIESMRANLLRAISHDLRTPLTSIKGNSALMLDGNLEKEQRTQLLMSIMDDSGWLIDMVENLLMVTRIEGNDLSIKTSQELAEEITSEAVQKIEKRYPGKGINVCMQNSLIMFPADAMLIEQVIINLVENAIVHSGNNSGVDIVVRDTPHAVIFSIKDYGEGIPEERLANLFDGRAYSMSEAADAHRGMGLGLSICKTIIAAHHGTIIGRNHSQGAEFVFTLPRD